MQDLFDCCSPALRRVLILLVFLRELDEYWNCHVFYNQRTSLRIKIFQLNNEQGSESVMFSLNWICWFFKSTEADLWWLSSLRTIWLLRCPQDRGETLIHLPSECFWVSFTYYCFSSPIDDQMVATVWGGWGSFVIPHQQHVSMTRDVQKRNVPD